MSRCIVPTDKASNHYEL